MKKFFTWLFVSSTDPEKMSLTVKGALLAIVPWILQLSSIACGIHICSGLDQNSLTQFVGAIADIVFWFFSIVAALGVAYGFVRKVYRTLTGTNRALD